MGQALLVIDVQESFRHAPYWCEEDLAQYLRAQNKLIAAAREAGILVVRVYHVEHDGRHFSRESGLIRPLLGSDAYADMVIEKNVHAASVGTGLADALWARDINRVIISGIRTEQCCETTTRHMSDLGFEIDYVTEATLTFPMVHANGRIYSPAEIKERTELVLAGRFARICTVDEVIATLPVIA